MEQLEIKYKTDYGAAELKKIYKKYLTIALVIGMVFHFLGIGAYWVDCTLRRKMRPKAP